jgi:hypothetical protein
MTLRGDDATAMREASLKVERSALGLQVKNAPRHDIDESDDFKNRMLLAFAEKKEHQLEVAYSKEQERAESEKLRADKAEQAYSQEHDRADSEKQRADKAEQAIFEEHCRADSEKKRADEFEQAHTKELGRAELEKLRADKAEQAASVANEEQIAARKQTLQALEESQTAMDMFDKSKQEAETAMVMVDQLKKDNQAAIALSEKFKKDADGAMLEADELRKRLNDAQVVIQKLEDELKEASKPQAPQDQSTINHLHATISMRDNKIEGLIDKNDKLTAERFNALTQINQHSDEVRSLRAQNHSQAAEITELSTKLEAVEQKHDRYVYTLTLATSAW